LNPWSPLALLQQGVTAPHLVPEELTNWSIQPRAELRL